MTRKRTHSNNSLYRPYDHFEAFMLSAVYAGQMHMECLTEAGSSGCLRPGAALRIPE